MLGAHGDVGSSVGLSSDEGDLGNSGFSKGIENLSSVLDDTSEFLGGSWKVAWHISESNQGDLESIAETNESSSLGRGINIQTTSKYLGLVGNESNSLAFNFSKTNDDVLGVITVNFIELVAVNNAIENDLDIVGLVSVERNDVVQNRARRLASSVEISPGSVGALFLAVLR